MINYLTQARFIDYNETLTPSAQGGGGGMSTKTARVKQVLSKDFRLECVSETADIKYEILMVEPMRLSGKSGNETVEEVIAGLQKHRDNGGKIIVYGSELTLLRLPNKVVDALDRLAHVFTANCYFQKRLFSYIGIDAAHILTDPVPEHVFTAELPFVLREKRVVASGTVSWFKNTGMVIDVFTMLKLKTDVQTCYLGSAALWNSGNADTSALEKGLGDVTDVWIKDANIFDVSRAMRFSRCGLWIGYHDCFAVSLHELFGCGVPVVSARHGLAPETPSVICDTVDDMVESITKITSEGAKWESHKRNALEYFNGRASYAAFNQQFKDVLRSL